MDYYDVVSVWRFQNRVASRSERPVQSVGPRPRQVEAFRVFQKQKYFQVVWRTSEAMTSCDFPRAKRVV